MQINMKPIVFMQMKFIVLLSLLFIMLLSIDHGQTWWGRRRRRGGGWFKKAVSAGVKFYTKNKPRIHGAINGWTGGDSQFLVNLATLKTYDHESYNEFMQQAAASLQEDYSAEEIYEVMQQIDDVADMQPDELELFKEGHDANPKRDTQKDELSQNLADRVAALNLE